MSNLQQTLSQTSHLASEKLAMESEKYQSAYLNAYQVLDGFLIAFWNRLPYLIIACLVILVFWFISRIFKRTLERALENRTPQRRNLIIVLSRIGHIAILFIGILVALMITIPSFTPAQAISGLGIGSVAIGFAFKDIFQNFLSGILILLGEPFKVGDHIQVNGMEGQVEDIQIRATYLRATDGRRLIIPNATVYTSAVTVNTAYAERRCECIINISNELSFDEVKQNIYNILKDNPNVLSYPSFDVLIHQINELNTQLIIRWWVNTQQTTLRQSVSEVQQQIQQYLALKN